MLQTIYRLCFALLLFSTNSQGQLAATDNVRTALSADYKDTVAWVVTGSTSLGINQGFLHNWAAGGELASLTVNSIFSGVAARYNRRHIWTNNLDLFYSLYYAYSQGFLPRKTDDRIDFTSKYGYLLDSGGSFYLAGLFNFRSQFSPGYDYAAENYQDYPTSRFLSPG